ncbi:MAG: AI-2E family transporter [Bdellovibrionales bacterium]|nr:AI-2E family transporter [Bdellovibrionales bacterium]
MIDSIENSINKPERKFIGFRVLVTTASLVVVIAGLQAASSILLPIMVALFLAVIGSALMTILLRFNVPTMIAVSAVGLLVVSVLVVLCMLLVQSINEFSHALPRYQGRITEVIRQYVDLLSSYGIKLSSENLSSAIQSGQIFDMLGNTLKGLANLFSKTLVVIIIMMFMLVEAADFRTKISLALEERMQMSQLEAITSEIQRYLGIKTVTSALTGIIVGIFVTIMGIDFPLLWAIIAFLMNFIPFIGSILASFPAILLALIQFDLTATLIVAIGYLVINIGISNFIEPILMGTQLGLSPLVVFLSLIVWGWIWGPIGMLLAVPLTMVLKILLDHSADFKWLALMMGPRVQLETEAKE